MFDMNLCIKKYISILLCFIFFISFAGCGAENVYEEETRKRPKSERTEKTRDKSERDYSDYKKIVICGRELYDNEYYIKQKKGSEYLMIEAEAFESAFKIPYLPYTYAKVERHDDGLIRIFWEDKDDIFLFVDIKEGSTNAVINGKEYDMGIAPEFKDDAIYIPANFFIKLLKMEDKLDKKLNTLFIDRIEDFPKDILVGTWSDNNTNLFVRFKDPVTGLTEAPSFAEAYNFRKDGTYRLIMISTGGFKDTFLYLEGKYIVHGNTIAFYDIRETLYQGEPLVLVHQNKRLDNEQYEYIHNYYPGPDEEAIKLTFRLSRIE